MKTSSSQTIKQVLEICEAYGMPSKVVGLIKSKCWKLVKNGKEGVDDGWEKRSL